MEKYSVLLTVYIKVKAEYLKLSIKSMLNQTVKPDQIVIVYDGPVTEDVNTVVLDYSHSNEGLFEIVKLPKNQGLAVALNAGLKICRNELIARMDSDDYSKPHRCETQLREFAQDKELALLGSNTQHFKDSPFEPDEKYSNQPLDLDSIKEKIRRNSAFSHPTVMFRKSAVLDCGGYDPILRRSQDHDLFSKMIYKGYVCRNVKDALVLFRADEDCKLRNRNTESCKARIIIQKRLRSRNQCSLVDFLYVYIGVLAVKYMPRFLYIFLYSLFKEKRNKK